MCWHDLLAAQDALLPADKRRTVTLHSSTLICYVSRQTAVLAASAWLCLLLVWGILGQDHIPSGQCNAVVLYELHRCSLANKTCYLTWPAQTFESNLELLIFYLVIENWYIYLTNHILQSEKHCFIKKWQPIWSLMQNLCSSKAVSVSVRKCSYQFGALDVV